MKVYLSKSSKKLKLNQMTLRKEIKKDSMRRDIEQRRKEDAEKIDREIKLGDK